ncbi:MAG: putative aminohydrolase SsnA [Candidatus Wallbacteria bacterium]|nr:putative aminohydrolase SsnA [Candidatus Wallbacteria bacterium]
MEILGNGPILTFDTDRPFIEDGAVAHEDGVIVELGSTADLRTKHVGATYRDREGYLLMPGLVNLHTHLYGSLARGMALKDPPPGNFLEILERLWWRLDRKLDAEAIRASAMVGLIDALMAGCTTLFDHHASPAAIPGSLDLIEECFEKVGLRGCLCYEVTDRDGEERALEGIRENARYLTKARSERFGAAFGLHASFTVGNATLDAVAGALPAGAGVHVHVAEDAADARLSAIRHGGTPVARLAERKLLGPNALLAHAVHVPDSEWGELSSSHSTVVHNPCSNMNNAVGALKLEKLLGAGVRVALGTDGYTASMLDEHAVAGILARHVSVHPGAGWASALELLTGANPAVASRFFPRAVGRIAPGCAADMITVRYFPPTPMSAANLGGHLLFGIARAPVDLVIVAGDLVARGGEPTRVDRREVFAQARDTARKLWARF